MIKYKINFLSEYHIGDGFSSGIADNTIIKDGKGRLVIPGHTIKGVIRDALENLLGDYRIAFCNGTLENNGKLCGVNRGGEKCFICQIFGSPFSKANFYFTPAIYEEQYRDGIVKETVTDFLQAQFRMSSHNRISRETGRVAGKHFFTYELGSSAEAFWGEITPLNPSADNAVINDCEILLLAALRLVRRIGGRRRKGWGSCLIEIRAPQNWRDMLNKKLKELLGVKD